MIIDIHAHIWGKSPEGMIKSKQTLLTCARSFGIDKIYVSGLCNYVSDEEEVDYLNAAVAQFMAEEPELIGGAVYVNPRNKNVLDVIKRATQEQGFDMIKLWCCTYADDPSVDPIMEYAEENGIPVLFHVFKKSTGQLPNETTGIHLANLARRHPKAKILMAHLGGSSYDGIPAIRDLKNVWCDQSGTIYHGDDLNYALDYLGADCILFGTDNQYLVNIGQVLGADLTQDQREKIFFKNAQKLLDRSFRL